MIIKLGEVLGDGSCGIVFSATLQETTEGATRVAAVKKSRVSSRVKRTILKHEARVLQLLQGHPAIPALYGHGQSIHFEYLAMELLGSAVRELQSPPNGLPLATVLRIADQMLSALEHIHSKGIVHCDIKPSNTLVCLEDPTKIRIVDFGISRRFRTVAPPRQHVLQGKRFILFGSVNWASINDHMGIDPSPRDDFESLAYSLLYLLKGDLPWRNLTITGMDDDTENMNVRECKRFWSGSQLAEGFPSEFGELLDHARGLGFLDKPDYSRFQHLFRKLFESRGFQNDVPLDWSAVKVPPLPPSLHTQGTSLQLEDQNLTLNVDSDDHNDDDASCSGFDSEIAYWECQEARHKSLTFPAEEGELLDGQVPIISQAPGSVWATWICSQLDNWRKQVLP